MLFKRYTSETSFQYVAGFCKKRSAAITVLNNDFRESHNFLLLFINTFIQLFTKEFCTLNIHLHLRLQHCLQNFGPVYSFCSILFERFNLKNFSKMFHKQQRYLCTNYAQVHHWKSFISTFKETSPRKLPELKYLNLEKYKKK